jgi:hypothetical protein
MASGIRPYRVPTPAGRLCPSARDLSMTLSDQRRYLPSRCGPRPTEPGLQHADLVTSAARRPPAGPPVLGRSPPWTLALARFFVASRSALPGSLTSSQTTERLAGRGQYGPSTLRRSWMVWRNWTTGRDTGRRSRMPDSRPISLEVNGGPATPQVGDAPASWEGRKYYSTH